MYTRSSCIHATTHRVRPRRRPWPPTGQAVPARSSLPSPLAQGGDPHATEPVHLADTIRRVFLVSTNVQVDGSGGCAGPAKPAESSRLNSPRGKGPGFASSTTCSQATQNWRARVGGTSDMRPKHLAAFPALRSALGRDSPCCSIVVRIWGRIIQHVIRRRVRCGPLLGSRQRNSHPRRAQLGAGKPRKGVLPEETPSCDILSCVGWGRVRARCASAPRPAPGALRACWPSVSGPECGNEAVRCRCL